MHAKFKMNHDVSVDLLITKRGIKITFNNDAKIEVFFEKNFGKNWLIISVGTNEDPSDRVRCLEVK